MKEVENKLSRTIVTTRFSIWHAVSDTAPSSSNIRIAYGRGDIIDLSPNQYDHKLSGDHYLFFLVIRNHQR